ncbi:hypothetical protein [Streptomyces olivochromogenes]|uniref:hypothetical protein n=1 Tax=Streptomyces olivochromogenes TaxID=1963 RepID=UPI0036AD8EC5
MSGEAILSAVVAVAAPVGALVFHHRSQRRKERREDTQAALDLLREVGVAVRRGGLSDGETLMRLSAQLGEIGVDIPEDVQPSLGRVRERLDSYGAVGVATPAGAAGARSGPPPSSALQDLTRAIDRARADIQRYRLKG